MTQEEIKKEIISLLPKLNIEEHGYGNASRESYRYVRGLVDAYLNVLGLKIEYHRTHDDIVRQIKSALEKQSQ